MNVAVLDKGPNKSRYADKVDKEEEELKKLIAQAKGEPVKGEEEEEEPQSDATQETPPKETKSSEEEPEPKTPEEKNWKKRYGDLQRHLQEKTSEFGEKIKSLEAKLETQANATGIPEEKLAEVAERNPVIMKLIEDRANNLIADKLKEFNSKFETLEEKEKDLQTKKAENEIREIHKDYDKIVESDEFHEWAGKKSWLQEIIYVDDYYKNPGAVADAISLYKNEKGIKPKEDTSKRKDSLREVTSKNTATPNSKDEPKPMRESFFASKEYLLLSDEDKMKAMEKWNDKVKKGEVIYDLR